MKTRIDAASPASPSALALEILELYKPPARVKRTRLRQIGTTSDPTPTKPRTEAEIALDKAREDWIHAHNVRLRKAREALHKKIAIAQEARRAKDGQDTGKK